MTDQYAVLGNPVQHSKSPRIHQLFAQQTRQDMTYQAIEIALGQFASRVPELFEDGLKGCNVTVPFKLDAWQLADVRSERAQRAGAVNTLMMKEGRLFGDNTDGAGLVRDICHNLNYAIQGRRVLLLGAGGAAQGVVAPVMAQLPAQLTICNRSVDKAQRLRDQLAPDQQACSFSELAGQCFDLVINATSTGLNDQKLPLPEQLMGAHTLAYDMMYGRQTPFMQQAAQQGAIVADGLGMLVEQAAESFLLWRQQRPDGQAVIAQLRN